MIKRRLGFAGILLAGLILVLYLTGGGKIFGRLGVSRCEKLWKESEEVMVEGEVYQKTRKEEKLILYLKKIQIREMGNGKAVADERLLVYLDEKGNLPGIEKCFQVDAVSTSVGALFGIPSMTTYLESSAGVEAGGKTGLTVIFTGICFLLMLFFSPIVLMIPTAATAPVLIYIGIHMLGAMKNIDYSDMTEYMPAFLCIGFTIFANNIANGICIAIPVYVLMKLISGKVKEIQPVMYIVTAICILYFITLI